MLCFPGLCECDVGFSGVDCGVNDSAVPVIFRLPYDGMCDLQDWSCEATLVYGHDIFDTEKLTCRIQHVQVNDRIMFLVHFNTLVSYYVV